MAPDASTPVRTATELEERLRRRLRLLSLIMAVTMVVVALLTVGVRRESLLDDPSRLFTEPPLPGVTFVIGLIGALFYWLLSPGRHTDLHRLRMLEWAGAGLTAAFFLFNQTLALRDLLPSIQAKPMELGVAQGAPWGMIIVAYAVLLPSSLRHAMWRTGAVAIVAFAPELLRASVVSAVAADQLVVYLTIKALIVGVMSALALYGAYRIEELGQQAEVARELGQYLLQRLIGEGGMGSVYLAEHRLLRRPCAVKLIRAEQANDERALARFEREVQSAAALTHPNTVQIYDYGQAEDGTFFFAMEFLPGISLDELVKQHGPVSPSRAVHILAQLCGALHEAHAAGLVHRDLKPGNVMLTQRGGVPDVVKLLDFGLVAALDPKAEQDGRLTRDGAIVGTPAYMSPEQCMDDAPVTAASDIYSLGALGYFLLTGSGPFTRSNAMQMIVAHVTEPAEPVTQVRPDVPEPLSAVLLRCLAKEPADRYDSVLSLERALATSVPAPWTRADAQAWWHAAAVPR